MPLVEEAKRTGAIDTLLYTRFVTRMREDQEPSPAAPADCNFTAADLTANAKLSFDDFDQRGVTPSTSRKLGERRCYAEAAKASEHYLIFGPQLDASQRIIVSFHMGQYLALAGDEQVAAKVIAGTRRPPIGPQDELDWSTYVAGTWAFLAKDREALQAAADSLSAAPGNGNAMNAKVLRGLNSCFERTYREAYETCGK